MLQNAVSSQGKTRIFFTFATPDTLLRYFDTAVSGVFFFAQKNPFQYPNIQFQL